MAYGFAAVLRLAVGALADEALEGFFAFDVAVADFLGADTLAREVRLEDTRSVWPAITRLPRSPFSDWRRDVLSP